MAVLDTGMVTVELNTGRVTQEQSSPESLGEMDGKDLANTTKKGQDQAPAFIPTLTLKL